MTAHVWDVSLGTDKMLGACLALYYLDIRVIGIKYDISFVAVLGACNTKMPNMKNYLVFKMTRISMKR